MGFSFRQAAMTKGGTGRKPFIEPGIDAELVVTKAQLIEGGYKGNSFVFEFRVLSAKGIAPGVTPPVVGSERAYVIDLDNKDYGLPNLMSVCEALEGGHMPGLSDEQKAELEKSGQSKQSIQETHEAKQEASLRQLIAEAVGATVRVTTNGVMTKKNEPFTAITWYHINQTIEQVRERRAQMAAGAL